MQTEQGAVSDMVSTKVPPLVSDVTSNNALSSWKLPSPPQPQFLDSNGSFPRDMLLPGSPTVYPPPYAGAGIYFCRGGDGYTTSINHALGHDARKVPVQLDTRMWSDSLGFVPPHAPSGPYFPLIDTQLHASLPHLAGGTQNFTACSFDSAPASDTGSRSQVILQTQPAPHLNSGSSSLVEYRHENVGPELGRSTSSQTTPRAFAFPDSTGHRGRFSGGPPVVLYRPPEKNGSSRRLEHRGAAISVGGLWIDKDDLLSVVGESLISVHECQWANRCGLWIIASRSHVGAHIRKWHSNASTNSKMLCLWRGCTAKAMLKDSINRHVVTVHLGERFHCQGCDQEFSRKDVYDQHVQKGELPVCKDAGAIMVYGTERRVIDTCRALQQVGGAVRYAN